MPLTPDWMERVPPPRPPWDHPPMRNAGAWQCPGCMTFYPMWVSKCECQKSSAQIDIGTLRDGDTTTLPTWGTFTTGPRTVGEGE